MNGRSYWSRQGKAYVDDQSPDQMRATRGTLTEPGTNSPFRDRDSRGKSRSVPAHAGGRIPERGARAARQDRHGVRQHQSARSGAVSHPARHPSAHRRHLENLSELRLCARPVGRDRTHHAFDLHAGIRGPSSALRLVHRKPAGAVEAASIRICAAQSHLHHPVEARSDQARAGRPCRGLGRPAHADACGRAPARRAAGGFARLRQAHRRRQGQQHRRYRDARFLDPRGAEQDRACAAWRCCGR